MAIEFIKFNEENQANTSKDINVPNYPKKGDVYSFGMVYFVIFIGH